MLIVIKKYQYTERYDKQILHTLSSFALEPEEVIAILLSLIRGRLCPSHDCVPVFEMSPTGSGFEYLVPS